MKLKFTKMHGTGNDFVVINGIHQTINFSSEQWRALADRHFGIGADQLLLVESSKLDDVDFRYRIFNADGTEVEHCGNGARCFLKFVRERGLTNKCSVRVQVQQGVIILTMREDGQVNVDMGVPKLTPSEIPFDASDLTGRQEGADTLWPLVIRDKTVWVSVVSMGNPHAVQVVENIDTEPVEFDGPLIEGHLRFQKGVNAGFLEIVDYHRARLRVHERGVGETLACGTGACAAAVAGIRRGLLMTPVTIEMYGGALVIDWDGGQGAVVMRGPAVTVFEGEIDLADVERQYACSA
ncbi:diaminopimelate epimerase [Candidatus Pandoraea novymonadis]|uniref:Diaminopimelate epimerase n=1 Tax=Candidatus Pandoraea novymonadis TaxID=1808959 RepID=A0ABX5FCZ4_9BURK|nr:diaminopimelate epimerase [Candidatus Pandoraea novymonadis]PSB91635.1 Diaminopimelate epimerase [Candidatus Pandoraea novymonadis]